MSRPTVNISEGCEARPCLPGYLMPEHECMPDQHRCIHCGLEIRPYGCNGCGRFLSSKELHDGEARCEDCR